MPKQQLHEFRCSSSKSQKSDRNDIATTRTAAIWALTLVYQLSSKDELVFGLLSLDPDSGFALTTFVLGSINWLLPSAAGLLLSAVEAAFSECWTGVGQESLSCAESALFEILLWPIGAFVERTMGSREEKGSPETRSSRLELPVL